MRSPSAAGPVRTSSPSEGSKQHAAFLIVALAVGMLNASAAAAQGDSGFYVGVGGGFGSASTLGSSVYGVNHPTRCDTLLYADPGMAPSSDPACRDMTPRVTSTGSVSPDPGIHGQLHRGLRLRSSARRIRVPGANPRR